MAYTKGTDTAFGIALPILGQGEVKQQDSTVDVLTVTLKGSATSAAGRPFVVQDSRGSTIFSVTPGGGIRTMLAFSTIAVASAASNVSNSYALAGATTDDAALLLPLTATATGSAAPVAYIGTADKLTVVAPGIGISSTTCAVWLFRTLANSATNT